VGGTLQYRGRTVRVRVLALCDDRTGVGHIALPIGHGDIWCVAIAHQEDADAVDGQRVVDLDGVLVRFFARSGGYLHGCRVVQGLTGVGFGVAVKEYVGARRLGSTWRAT